MNSIVCLESVLSYPYLFLFFSSIFSVKIVHVLPISVQVLLTQNITRIEKCLCPKFYIFNVDNIKQIEASR